MPKNQLRAALYARVSTGDQQTLPMQIDALRHYSKQRGWQVIVEVRDVGSGALERPKRAELMKAARTRRIDVVVVWKLDRWGRSVADLVTTMKELHALGVAFVSLTESLDLTTPVGRAMAGLLAIFAEFERDVLRERILAGMAAARKEGKHLGRPATIEQHAAVIRELADAGISKAGIARHLGTARSTVRVYLAQSLKSEGGVAD